MNKADLARSVADKTGLSQSAASDALDAVLESIEKELAGGGEVAITGFGKFSVAHRGARQGVNPATGQKIQIAASKAPKFSAGAKFKARRQGLVAPVPEEAIPGGCKRFAPGGLAPGATLVAAQRHPVAREAARLGPAH